MYMVSLAAARMMVGEINGSWRKDKVIVLFLTPYRLWMLSCFITFFRRTRPISDLSFVPFGTIFSMGILLPTSM